MKRLKVNASRVVKLTLFTSCLVLVSGVGAFRTAFTQSGKERKLNVRHFGETPPVLVGAEVGAHVRNHLDAQPGLA